MGLGQATSGHSTQCWGHTEGQLLTQEIMHKGVARKKQKYLNRKTHQKSLGNNNNNKQTLKYLAQEEKEGECGVVMEVGWALGFEYDSF